MVNKTNIITRLVVSVFFTVLCVSITANGRTYYVDDNASGANDGSSWANAFNYLQNALSVAADSDEIKVAQGIYAPDDGFTADPNTSFSDSRDATFELVNDVILTGGYAGIGQIDPDARDIEIYKTILSGDLNGDDDIQYAEHITRIPTAADNCWHVITCNCNAVLDGFAVVGGNADGLVISGNDCRKLGGGMFIVSGSPTVINCTFVVNYGDHYGGAIYNSSSSTNIINCIFDRNSSRGGGGGIYNNQCSPNITNCMFTRNSSEPYDGGGIYNYNSNPVITNCTFTGNSAQDSGGGMYNEGSRPTLTNCTFSKNHAFNGGGGICNEESNPNLANCLFTENIAGDNGGGIYAKHGDLNLTNCSFTGNQAGSSGGGGIKGYNCALNLTNCEFIENSTRYGEGGGVATEKNYPNLTNCSFIENSARAGGGLYSETSNPILTNCVFRGNSVNEQGGGMCSVNKSLSGDSPILRNCLFTGNHSGFRGGAIYNLSCEPVLANCTFAENWAGEGNAIYCKSEDERNTITLTNCILWDYGTEIETWDNNLSIINVSYSNIRGGWFGEGNIDEDPLFVDLLGPDHTPGTEDDNLRLSSMSPSVDSGDPDHIPEQNETDLDGNPRIVGDLLDMGAYEFQGYVYVDDDAPYEQWTGEPEIDHLEEDGTEIRPFDTIQEAIDIAKDGYTVLVRPGLYGKIDFKGKAITVTGTEGAAMIWAPPLLENTDNYDAVTFHTGEGRGSVLKNFFIRSSSTAISLNFSSPKIHNVTIVNNDFGIAAYENSNPDIRNCILWNNTNGDLFQCEAKYSCVETGSRGEGNINANPLFVDAANGDYHLKSEGWRWNTASQSWTWDDVTSPCIDAGDPCSPLGDEPMRVPRDPNNLYGINQYINMGAYGGTCQASMPPLNWPPVVDDRTPPVPDPAQWAPDGAPREVQIGTGIVDYWIEMKAQSASDASGFVEYFFECTTESGFSSGWKSSNEYKVQIGRSGQGLRFRVKARDLYGNETAWSEERTAH